MRRPAGVAGGGVQRVQAERVDRAERAGAEETAAQCGVGGPGQNRRGGIVGIAALQDLGKIGTSTSPRQPAVCTHRPTVAKSMNPSASTVP